MHDKVRQSKSGKLPIKTKLGYGVGQMTDSISANIFVFFFVFFLTNVAGVNPATAGVISLIATLWDAVTDPVIGYISDNIVSKYGRRRPMILFSAVPIGIAIWLMFTSVKFTGSAKTLYYIAVAMFYYTAYTCYYVPYMALGGELTTDYNERTSIRFYCLSFQLLGVFIASTGTTLLVDKISVMVGSINLAWSLTAGIFGAFSTIAAIASWYFTRGLETVEVKPKTSDGDSFFKTLKDTLSIKSVQVLITAVVLYAVGFSISNGILVFLINNNIQLDGGQQVFFWTFFSLIGLVSIPLSNYFGSLWGKKKAYMYLIGAMAVIQLGFSFIGFTFTLLLVFVTFLTFGHNTYFGLHQSMMYDCCEAFEFKTGLKKQGAVTSIVFLFQKMGFAIGMWLMGLVMQTSGYIGTIEVQSVQALASIKALATIYAPALYLVSAACLIYYKLDGATFKELQDVLTLRANSKNKAEEIEISEDLRKAI